MVFSLETPPRDITERVWDDKLVVGNRQSLKDMEIWQFSTKPWEVTVLSEAVQPRWPQHSLSSAKSLTTWKVEN